jgi:hypothetical protein
MARPKNPNRDAVSDETLTVRFTKPEIARLKVLLAQRETELRGTGARITPGGLVRAIVVAKLDELRVEAPEATGGSPEAAPVQPSLPGLEAPGATRPATAPTPFWYGISDAGPAVEWLQPRQASREEMISACRDAGLTVRGPFETRQAAWTSFDRERAEKEARAVPPPPPPPQTTSPAPASPPPAATPSTRAPTKKTPAKKARPGAHASKKSASKKKSAKKPRR